MRGLAVPIKNTILNRFLFNTVLTHIIANSIETKRTITKNLCKSINIDQKVKVIYHGIDLKLFDKKSTDESFQNSDQKLIIGNAGRLTYQKRQIDLIKIAHKLKEKGLKFKMLIAGTGELKAEIEKSLGEYNLQDEIILLGFVEDIASFMRSIDIFVLPSAREGFGYVIVEAMAASKPVVAYNVSSNPEIIRENQTGYLIDHPDLEMFCTKVELLLRSKDERILFGQNGRMIVEKMFQLDDKITELENIC
jgi:glycosyltransferase involved in cell wall biosynthesis